MFQKFKTIFYQPKRYKTGVENCSTPVYAKDIQTAVDSTFHRTNKLWKNPGAVAKNFLLDKKVDQEGSRFFLIPSKPLKFGCSFIIVKLNFLSSSS